MVEWQPPTPTCQLDFFCSKDVPIHIKKQFVEEKKKKRKEKKRKVEKKFRVVEQKLLEGW